MDEEVKQVTENIAKLSDEIVAVRTEIAELREANKGNGELTEELNAIAKDLTKDLVTRQELDNAKKYTDEVNAKVDALKHIQGEANVEDTKHRDTIMDFLRSGGKTEFMKPESREFLQSKEYHRYASFLNKTDLESRTITEGNPASAGIFVDPQTEADVLKNYTVVDDVRSVARVITISGTNELKGFRRTGAPTAYHAGEVETGTASQSAYAPFKIGVHPIIVKTPVSADMLEDVPFIYSEVVADAGEAFGYTEGYDFVLGSGIDRPLGFYQLLADTDTTKYMAQVTGAGTAVLDKNDFAHMWTELKVPYRANATWAFNSTSLYQILVMEATTGNYIWNPGLQSGPPDKIYGRPYIICENLPDAANDILPLYLADWSKLYYIVDRSGIQMLRDDITSAWTTTFNMRKRFGGQVVKPEAGVALLTT